MKIEPIERLIINGITKRFARTFSCKQTLVTNAYEKMRQLRDRNATGKLDYPVAFLKVTNIGAATDRYVSPYLARTGVQIVPMDDDNAAWAVKLLPAVFQVEVEYRTNEFDLSVEHSVLGFCRNWLFARRNGDLKFNVNYGKLAVMIGVVMDEQVSIPDKANPTEQSTEYILSATFQLNGWISKPEARVIGTVQEVEVTNNFWTY